MIPPEQWLGYLEHKTPELLGVYTANPGKGGYTIFATMIALSQRRNLQGVPWCTTFVHACINRPDILGRAHPGSRVLRRRMRRKGLWRGREYTPQPNDIIFCSNMKSDRVDHCGIVRAVDGHTVISIDGNTTDPSGVFAPEEGGCVAYRTHDLSDPIIVGYAAIGKLLFQERGST